LLFGRRLVGKEATGSDPQVSHAADVGSVLVCGVLSLTYVNIPRPAALHARSVLRCYAR
jgi:hypothetical protein